MRFLIPILFGVVLAPTSLAECLAGSESQRDSFSAGGAEMARLVFDQGGAHVGSRRTFCIQDGLARPLRSASCASDGAAASLTIEVVYHPVTDSTTMTFSGSVRVQSVFLEIASSDGQVDRETLEPAKTCFGDAFIPLGGRVSELRILGATYYEASPPAEQASVRGTPPLEIRVYATGEVVVGESLSIAERGTQNFRGAYGVVGGGVAFRYTFIDLFLDMGGNMTRSWDSEWEGVVRTMNVDTVRIALGFGWDVFRLGTFTLSPTAAVGVNQVDFELDPARPTLPIPSSASGSLASSETPKLSLAVGVLTGALRAAYRFPWSGHERSGSGLYVAASAGYQWQFTKGDNWRVFEGENVPVSPAGPALDLSAPFAQLAVGFAAWGP